MAPALPFSEDRAVGQAHLWGKLSDMPTIRRLVMVYALAGVDCVDVAADMAVVRAAHQGMADAITVAGYLDAVLGPTRSRDNLDTDQRNHFLGRDLPWLMISLNDSEDPHFRKAFLDAAHCPDDCPLPCEAICPTDAIHFKAHGQGGVVSDLCYGCGRCLTVCPVHNITAHSYQARPENFSDEALASIDAVEIHTQAGRQSSFSALWQRLEPWRKQLKLVSISCPDDHNVERYLRDLYEIMAPLEIPLIWQTDGRPMSGDLGKGTTHATIRLAQKVIAAQLPGHVQLAGGTNRYTASKLRDLGLVTPHDSGDISSSVVSTPPINAKAQTISGIAYGSYARTLVMPLLDKLDPVLTQILEAQRQGSPVTPPPRETSFDKTRSFCTSSKIEPVSIMDSTSALVTAIAQARQIVGALKWGDRI